MLCRRLGIISHLKRYVCDPSRTMGGSPKRAPPHTGARFFIRGTERDRPAIRRPPGSCPASGHAAFRRGERVRAAAPIPLKVRGNAWDWKDRGASLPTIRATLVRQHGTLRACRRRFGPRQGRAAAPGVAQGRAPTASASQATLNPMALCVEDVRTSAATDRPNTLTPAWGNPTFGGEQRPLGCVHSRRERSWVPINEFENPAAAAAVTIGPSVAGDLSTTGLTRT